MFFAGRGNGLHRLIAAAIILLAAAASLYGRGAREDDVLYRADRLIAQRDFDAAILLLANYMGENPDRFLEGQTRMRYIVRTRELYNQVVTMLLDTVENDPDNGERILELSNLLVTIESPTNPAVREFLAVTRYLAEFNAARMRFERILVVAREQLARNDFSAALATYASGLDIFQDEYFASGFGQEAEDLATWGLEGINRSIRDFNAIIGPFANAALRIAAMDRPSLPAPGELREAYASLSPLLEELTAINKGLANIQQSFVEQFAILQAEHNVIGDRSFLAFASSLITGPSGRREGMAGTLERFWRLKIDPVKAAMTTIVDRSYQAGFDAMTAMNFQDAVSAFETTAQYIAVARDIIQSSIEFAGFGDSPAYLVHGEIISGEMVGVYLKLRSMNASLSALQQAGVIGIQGAAFEAQGFPSLSTWQSGAIDTPQAISLELNVRGRLGELLGGLQILQGGIESELNAARNYEETLAGVPGGPGTPHVYLAGARDIIMDIAGRLGSHDFYSAIRLYTIANADLAMRITYLERAFNEGNSLIQGVDRGEGFGAFTARFPSEGLEILNRINEDFERDIGIARDLLARYAAEDNTVFTSPEINTLHAAAQNLYTRLMNLQARSSTLIVAARLNVNRATALRVDADRLFQAAQTALAQADFDGARGNLVRAIDQYDASLAIQESAALRSFRDTNLVLFGAEIVRIENEIVVRDVRDLVTAARNSYFGGNMEQAENLLTQAQTRWRVTNITEQPEVEHWLRLVRGAMSLDLARNISPTAPLFAEMSQLLSNANRSYIEGVRLINAGRRGEGMLRFNEALDQTREVRIMFPMNHSARMLELRIEQRTDSAAFNAAFQQRLNEAVAGTRERRLEAFADLQDLVEINPQFPGIRAILTQAEIDMGFRPPPPNPVSIARSSELTRSAEVHVNNGDPISFGVAEAQLEEAIRLNPNNTAAQVLMDRLHILMTGTGRFVLSSHAQTQYNIALQEFLRGNHLTANAIVQQLLQDPESQRSTLVQDLRRRIDAFL